MLAVALRHVLQILRLTVFTLLVIVEELIEVVVVRKSGNADGRMDLEDCNISEIGWECHNLTPSGRLRALGNHAGGDPLYSKGTPAFIPLSFA
jgi:hypothetical protein